MELSDINVSEISGLYERNLFLDAYRATQPLWQMPELAEQMNAEHLILAGRLAGRLGGQRIRRWLLRKAGEQFPEHPLTRVYCREYQRKHSSVYDHLRDFESRPELDCDNRAWNATWYASNAVLWGYVRNFEQAHALIDRALALGENDEWTHCCRAWVHLYQDQWDEARTCAERAWELSRAMPSTIVVLGRILIRLELLDEALERIVPLVASGQSYENVMYAIWLLATKAERCRSSDRQEYTAKMAELCRTLETMAPLTDREVKAHIAHCHIWTAFLQSNNEEVRHYAGQIPTSFFREIKKNVEERPSGASHILNYKSVLQKHSTCLPSSVAAVMGNFDIDIDEDQLAQSLTYDGTPTWRVVEWLTSKGYCAKPFIATAELCRKLLKAGLPFVYTVRTPDLAHAMAAIGYDDAMDTMILHDPSSERWTMVLMGKIQHYEGPYGPECLAVAPVEKQELLNLIPQSASFPAASVVKYYQVWEEQGQLSCRAIVEEL
ncbi:MAG: C39 family peptidase, partial [Planctomycetota bacterium]